MQVYTAKQLFFTAAASRLSKKYNTISIIRVVLVILCSAAIYYYVQTAQLFYGMAAIICLIMFAYFMRLHAALSMQRKLNQALLEININEAEYANRTSIPFKDGAAYNDFTHPYAYDLDIFGAHSLFQNINRTATHVGEKTLAARLLFASPATKIKQNQEAIQELASKLEWRQEFLALGKVGADTAASYQSLLKWTSFNSTPLPRLIVMLMYASPALFLIVVVLYVLTAQAAYASCLGYIFIFNLIILGIVVKRIMAEVATSTKMDAIIYQYSLLLQKIEKESFKASKLKLLQQQLSSNQTTASVHLKHLSELFSKMDSIANFVTATVFNGTFLFNVHVFKQLILWKNTNGALLEGWLAVIGEIEMLNSLANVAYNNPDYVFPTINNDFQINFKGLSHPLLNAQSRVGNDVAFHPQSFMILTGSNMSGKSTFLRSLGINMVLAGIGAPVCATAANVHPLPVQVSMRLSDSLADSESYFFAEIKRLKQIMDTLEGQPAFILLDEILRGTNSDDKRNGTIEVVKKAIGKQAIGAIATHDIEVCLTTDNFPEVLINKCFEVEIINNELHFDYKLRDGVCKNKSATFLMKKMGVI